MDNSPRPNVDLNTLALKSFEEGDFTRARELYSQFLEQEPDNNQALLHHGHCCFAAGDFHSSRMDFEHSVQLNERQDTAWYGLALSQYKLGDHVPSLSSFEKALELKPDDVDYLVNYGIALHTAGKVRKAMEIYERSLALDPSEPRVHVNYALSLIALDRYADAERHFRKALEVDERAVTWYELGDVLFKMNEFSRAEEAFSKALNLSPAMEPASKMLYTLRGLSPSTERDEQQVNEQNTLEALENERKLLENEFNRITAEKERLQKEKEVIHQSRNELCAAAKMLDEGFNLVNVEKEEIRKGKEELGKKVKELGSESTRIEAEFDRIEEERKALLRENENLQGLKSEMFREKQDLDRDRLNLEETSLTIDDARDYLEREKGLLDEERDRLNRIRDILTRERDVFDKERQEIEKLEMQLRLKIHRSRHEKEEVQGMEFDDHNKKAPRTITEFQETENHESPPGRLMNQPALDDLLKGKLSLNKDRGEGIEPVNEPAPDTLISEHPEAVLREGRTVNYFECPDCGFMIGITTSVRPLEIACNSCHSRYRLKGKKKMEEESEVPTVDKKEQWNAKAELSEKATKYHKQGLLVQAIELYNQILEIWDRDPVVWNNKGVALDSQGMHPDAANCYLKAIELRSSYSDAWFNLSYSQFRMKQYEKSMESLRTLLRIAPDHKQGNDLMDRCEEKLKAWKKLLD